MARRKSSPLFQEKAGAALLLAAIVLVLVDTARGDEQCRTGCRHGTTAQNFKYQEGTTYKYNYDSKIEVSLSSAEGQKTTTEVKAEVLLTQLGECNQVLRLKNVQVLGSDGKKHGTIPDVEKPIRLNFHDGHLEDSICAVPGDTQNSINVKRAVASLFQANLDGGHETDVFGRCPNGVTHHREGNLLTVTKTRDLNRCAYREHVQQDFLSTAFNLDSEIKSSPLLNGDYSATLKIKNGILDQAAVAEDYLYMPFSVGSNGAKAHIRTSLKYVGTGKDAGVAKVSQPRSIIFESPHPVHSPGSNVNTILAAVKETAKTITVTVGEQTAKEFINLVRIVRVSNKADLLTVYNQVKAGVGFADKTAAKKLFLDAILRAGNGDTLEVAIDLLKTKELDAVEQRLVYLGLSLVRHTTEGAIAAATDLLDQPNLPREAYLGIGALAGRHCRQHHCKNDALNKLAQRLVQKIGNGKASNRKQENDIIFALKALANLRHLGDNVVPKIVAIAQDKKSPTRLRVAALETYQSDPCKDKLRDSALTILKDIQQDSEIRIKAYLALAQCPNSKVGNAVKTLLEHEPSYQVGGFIVSHIRNLRSSTNPDKELAKQHLGLVNVPKRFPLDPRKYSLNTEFSYTVDTLGLANSIESNLIYSQTSFLPRSASLNLTADVFGHSFNFLELETRQENLARLIEHYVGPKGLLRSLTLQDLWDTKGKYAKDLVVDLRDRVGKALRSRRDVTKAEIESINKQVQVKTNDLNLDLDLDLSVRSFGSELLFVNINDDARKFTPEAIIDRIVDGINEGIDKIKRFEETVRSNVIFLDGDFSYPTSAGFPLRLGVEGSANVQVKASGAIDLRAILKEPTTVKISLIPSANIEVAGRLTIDALVLENGLKTISTLHTATGGDLIVDLLKDGVDIKFSLPLEKQDLLTLTHDIVFHTREQGVAEVNRPLKFAQNKDFAIGFDQLSPFIGLSFNAEITGPNLAGKQVPILPFPLAGDAKIAVTIDREDVSLYHFKKVVYGDKQQWGSIINIETLDKNNQRKVSLDVEAFLRPEVYAKATVKSAIFSGSVEGRITDSDKEKSLLFRFNHDTQEYLARIGVAITGSDAKAIYKPIIEYKTPENSGLQIPPYRVEGQIVYEKNGNGFEKRYTFDNIRLVVPDHKTIAINGNLGNERDAIFADLSASDGTNSASLKGRLQVSHDLVKYNIELKNSLNPSANVEAKGEIVKGPEEIRNSFQIAHGSGLSNKKNVFSSDNSLKYRNKGPQDFLLETKNRVTYPVLGLDVQGDFELKPKEVDYKLNVQYSDVKLGSELDWKHTTKPEGTEFDLEFQAWGLSNRVEVKSRRHLVGEVSQIDNSLDINGKRVEVTGKIKHHIVPHDLDINIDLTVKTPTHNTPFKVTTTLKVDSNEFDGSHKVTNGNDILIDTFLKATKVGNANGSIKINIKDYLVVSGQVRGNQGTGTGDITIELPAVKRVTKADGTFTLHDPNYNLEINIYPIFNEDPKKKLSIGTTNKLSLQAIDSRSSIDFFGHKLEVNAKASRIGGPSNGKLDGQVEVTLPNDHYLLAKINREARTSDSLLNAHGQASIEHRKNKNTAGSKLTVKADVKNSNLHDQIYDITYQLVGECEGKTLNSDIVVKRQPRGDQVVYELSNKLSGSVLSGPIDASLKGSYKGRSGQYEARVACPHNSFGLTGKYDLADGRPLSGELNLQGTSDSKILKSLKASLSGSVTRGERVELRGEGSVFADAPEGVIIDLGANGQVSGDKNDLRVKGTVRSSKIEPITIDAGLKRGEAKDQSQVNTDATVTFGKGQTIKAAATIIKLPLQEYKLDLHLDTPTDKFRSNRLQIHTRSSDEGNKRQSDLTLTSDGKVWTLNSDLHLVPGSPSIDIKAKCPEGKIVQLLLRIARASDKVVNGDLKIVNDHKDFLLEAGIDSNIESVEEFRVKVNAHCPSLKVIHYVIEAQSKGSAKAGKRIQVTAQSDNRNILSGSTSYTTREEKGKLIIEGSGSFKVKEETQSANFKYIRENLTKEKNGETGIEISFDAGLGNKAIDAELKITNKQFRILNSYCEEKKQCAHIEVDAKTSSELSNFSQEIEISVDLRKLGLSHEFGVKAVTIRKDYVIDHTVDVHFQSQENSKYQYSLYVHPKEAGVSLTTPKRVIALEANVNAPPDLWQVGGKVTSELVFYTDKKNQPNQKSGLVGALDVDPKSHRLQGEVKFTNPALQRPITISLDSKLVSGDRATIQSVVVLDVFSHPNQKLTITTQQHFPDLKQRVQFDGEQWIEIKSPGLGIDIKAEETVTANRDSKSFKVHYGLKYHVGSSQYDSGLNFEASPDHSNFLLRVLNIDLLKVNSQLKFTSDLQVVDTEIGSYGTKPVKSHLEIKNWNTVKYWIARLDTPNDKLTINAGLIPGQIADFRADVTGAELIHATLKLDEANFLKSDYGVNSDNIDNLLLKPIKEHIVNHVQELKTVGDEWAKIASKEAKQLGEIVKRAAPNVGPITNYYTSELAKIRDEVLADKTIKDLSEFAHGVIAALTQAFGETFKNFSSLVEDIAKSLHASFSKVLETIDKDLLPRAKEALDKILATAGKIASAIADVVLTYIAKVTQILEKYQPELKQLGSAISEVTRDITSVLVKAYQSIRDLVVEKWQEIHNELRTSPIVEQLRADYRTFVNNYLPNAETVKATVTDIVSTIKDLAPTDELKELVGTVGDYIVIKLTLQPVDDRAHLDKIFKATLAVVKRLTDLVSGLDEAPQLHGFALPMPVNLFAKLPRLVAIRLSPLSYLLREDSPSVASFVLSLVNRPRNWVAPFPLYGLIAQGQHIFTFDGKHLTFPGKCNYLLARDALDGNFTVIGSYDNGLLTAITLSVAGDSLTLKKGGSLLHNANSAEYPIHRPNLSAYRKYDSLHLISKVGVHVICGPELIVCSVTLSGFYHGRTRGLLGNGNNEPYDDLVLGNGKIVSSESEFANSYKATPSCPEVKAVAHEGHGGSAPTCDKLFAWDSSLSLCYPFVAKHNFRVACQHGVASSVKDTEFAVAVAYVAACQHHGIPVHVPEAYVSCGSAKIGEALSVKTPGKSADIVLLVDTSKKNEPVYKDYVQPLVQQISNELHSKGVQDVEFHIIAYGGSEHRWPSHITVGGKLAFKGKAPHLKFADLPAEKPLATGNYDIDNLARQLRTIAQDIELALGLDLQARTYTEGINYPFRPEAIKSVIAITGNPCTTGTLYPLQVLRTLLYRSKNIDLNLITPFEKLVVKDAKHTKETVGFNSETVFTIGQGKKAGKSGHELHKDLDYSDYCVDFTLQNGGNVFTTDSFLAAKGPAKKQFVQVASHQIVEQLTSVERGFDCECTFEGPYGARSVCHVVHEKEKKKAGKR